MEEVYRQARRAALVSMSAALGLGVIKLLGGWLGHSLALVSDAVHSLGDALASAAVWGALLWAQRPADAEHPYGHMRVEAVAGSNVALLLILSALGVAWNALQALAASPSPPEHFTLFLAAASAAINELVYRYCSRVARRTGSRAVLATSWDQRLDALSSLAVLLGIALACYAGPAWHAGDRVAALLVAAFILWAGSSLFWQSFQELMDRQAEHPVLETIRQQAQTVPGVRGVEKLLVRKAGLQYLVDIHIEVDPNLTVQQGHAIGHAVKDHLLATLPAIKDVLVHLEPARCSQ